MIVSKKIIVGAVVVGLGFLQYQLVRHRDQASPLSDKLEVSVPAKPVGSAAWVSGTMAPYVQQRHVARPKKRPGRDLSVSVKAQKERIVRNKLAKKGRERTVLPDDFDPYKAKENMRDLLFGDAASNGKTNTLSDVEKREIVESGAVAW